MLLRLRRFRVSGSMVWRWAVPAVALLMLGLMLMPAEFWNRPTIDGTYNGFDPNLMYVGERGNPALRKGIAKVSRESIELTALPDSTPTVHLISSLLDFRAEMDVRILENDADTIPLRIELWTPKKGIRHYLEFGPAPENLVTAKTVEDRGPLINVESLGTYNPNQSYHVEMSLDRNLGIIESSVSAKESPPMGGSFILLAGGPGQAEYREIHHDPVAVEGGRPICSAGRSS